MKNTIVITGGHITPAHALIEQIKRNWNVVLIGRRYAFAESKDLDSFEYLVAKKEGLDWHESTAPRFPREFSISSILFPYHFFRETIRSYSLLKTYNPRVVCTFGGYIAVPVALAAYLRGIPVILHEQTQEIGGANSLISRIATEQYVSWPETFDKNNKSMTYTGNPVRTSVLSPKKSTSEIASFITTSKKPILYVTGGSSGAHGINQLIATSIRKLLTNYCVVHQCGDSYYHDFKSLNDIREKLPIEQRKCYLITKYVQDEDIGLLMREADIIVSRSGANTICELALLGKISVLIPLPQSAKNEQQINAKRLKQNGTAIVLGQNSANTESLIKALQKIMNNKHEYDKKAKKYQNKPEISIHEKASSVIAHHISKYTVA